MSDLSQPALTLAPLDDAAPPFLWPTPPFAAYPAPQPQVEPQRCEVEGLNGGVMSGKLMSLDAALGVAHVQVPPARVATALRFSQFRRLTLTAPLQPPPEQPSSHPSSQPLEPHAGLLAPPPRQD
jgi:hypothetical protein